MSEILFNGSFCSPERPLFHADDRGLTLGDGLFETMLALDGKPVFFEEHLARLSGSADFLEIPLPFNIGELHRLSVELLQRNALNRGQASMRLTLTRGRAGRGVAYPEQPRPEWILTASSVPTFPAEYHLETATIRRNEFSPLSNHKTLSFLENVLAARQATEGREALLLNTAGNIAECAISNLMFIRENRLVTPAIKEGVLPGIVRAFFLSRAGELGLSPEERTCPPDELYRAELVFRCNSLTGPRICKSLDNRELSPDPNQRMKAITSLWMLAVQAAG